jgi:hypothetical protein
LPCRHFRCVNDIVARQVSIVTTGSELSTSTSCEVEALLPALSVTLAVTV